MPKPRIRLMNLSDCTNGTRYYTNIKHRPQTLVTINKKTNEAIYHNGHAFNMQAKKYRGYANRKVWVVINFKDLP